MSSTIGIMAALVFAFLVFVLVRVSNGKPIFSRSDMHAIGEAIHVAQSRGSFCYGKREIARRLRQIENGFISLN